MEIIYHCELCGEDIVAKDSGNSLSLRIYSYTYDFCINNKLLIEYDGSGYYHPNEIKDHDIAKENFAKEHSYNFIRLTLEDIHKIETLNKIKELI